MRRRLKEGASFALQQVKNSQGGSFAGDVTYLDKPIFQRLSRLGQYGMLPIGYADAFANTLTLGLAYQTAYDSMKKHGDQIATDYANAEIEKLLGRTAQPTQGLSLSNTEQELKSHPFASLMVRFMSETRKTTALNMEAIMKLSTGKGRGTRLKSAERLAYTWVAYTAVESVIRSLYEELFKEEDEERGFSKLKKPEYWMMKLTAGKLNSVPFFGEGMHFIFAQLLGEKTYNTSDNPLLRPITKTPKAVEELVSDSTPGEKADAVIDLFQQSGIILPILGQVGNVGEAGKGFADNTLGIVWSKNDEVRNAIENYVDLEKELTGVKGDQRYTTQAEFINFHTEGFTKEMKEKFLEKANVSESVKKKLK